MDAEIAADQDEFWFETYGRVAATGEAARFEAGSTPLGRWWAVYAFRIGDPGLRRIGVLFNDITDRNAARPTPPSSPGSRTTAPA